MKPVQYVVALAVLALLSPTWAWARPKTDVITLYNGDKLTGELRSMYGGIAEFKTDAMGTVKIEWKHIARVESKYHYEIRLTSGQRHYGGMGSSAIPGQLQLVSDQKESHFEMLEVVEIRQIESSFLDRLDIYLAAGYSYTKASSVGQTTFNTEINYEDERSVNTFTGRTTITDTNEEVTRSTKFDLSRQAWTDRSQSLRVFYGRFETNDELGLDYRYTGGAGLGKFFVDRQDMRWINTMGLQVLTEQSSESGKTAESLEAFLSTEFAAWRFDTPELDLSIKLNLFPSLSETRRLRGDTDIRIRWELVEDLYWDITAFGTYDNKSGISHEVDYGITTGVGWTY